MANTRFPHTCRIWRTEDATPFGGGTEEVIYEGVCRNYSSKSTRQQYRVIESEYTLAIPRTADGSTAETSVAARAGDEVEVTDLCGTFRGTVVDCYAGTMGNNVYWNNDKN